MFLTPLHISKINCPTPSTFSGCSPRSRNIRFKRAFLSETCETKLKNENVVFHYYTQNSVNSQWYSDFSTWNFQHCSTVPCYLNLIGKSRWVNTIAYIITILERRLIIGCLTLCLLLPIFYCPINITVCYFIDFIFKLNFTIWSYLHFKLPWVSLCQHITIINILFSIKFFHFIMKNISLVVLLVISFFFLRISDQFGILTACQVDQTEQLIHIFLAM